MAVAIEAKKLSFKRPKALLRNTGEQWVGPLRNLSTLFPQEHGVITG